VEAEEGEIEGGKEGGRGGGREGVRGGKWRSKIVLHVSFECDDWRVRRRRRRRRRRKG